ncbi:MAG: AMP-binding protein [Candidatus Cloacimonadaceae bacterium]|jgi:long-chain acyl-CoA synthetase
MQKFTLKAMIDRSCELYSERPALSNVDGEPITYGQLRQQIDHVIALMREHGIRKGDRVAILSQNMPTWGVAYLAITSMGAVVVPILVDFHVTDILHIIKHAEAKLVFVSSLHYPKIGYEDLKPMPQLVILDNFEPVKEPLSKDKLKGRFKHFNILKGGTRKASKRIGEEPKEDDLAALIYTSGTSGYSKGVMLSHKNLTLNVHLTCGFQKVHQYDRLMSILPLPHAYECTVGFLTPMHKGACVYYLDKPPTARVLIPAMQKVRPTIMLTVPLIIEKIFKLQVYPQLTRRLVMRKLYNTVPGRKMLHRYAGRKLLKTFGGALHLFAIGGALLSEEVERFLYEAGFPYTIGYGLTETSPLIAACTASKIKFRSTGNVLETLQVRIANPDPKTGIGEIEIKGGTVMMGYYKDKQRTKDAHTEDGYFKTGDLGMFNNDYLYIKGRSKNMILSPTGENVYPEELEAKLNENEGVLESMVYESDGKIIGRVYLNAELFQTKHNLRKMGHTQSEAFIQNYLQNLREHVNANVASFARIHRLTEQKEPFEKTPTQKIKRFLYS